MDGGGWGTVPEIRIERFKSPEMHIVEGKRSGMGGLVKQFKDANSERGKEERTGKTRRGLKAFVGLDERRQNGL